MSLEKIFNDLESNQNQESEQAKEKLIELFTQNKEQYLVHYMMEYYLKTASVRIIEVLVKVQSPHDGFILDRLSDWLKIASHRIHALNLFCFIVRKHPTWLFKVEKHRLIKDMLNWLKQLEIEKEIVPLMSALLVIITLLPIIPNLVPNFLNDLFAVFAHLATWNNQNPNCLGEDKLVHLQLGLQMLFYRLYGMFPCNFMSFLTEFTRREKGAIFQHTIKPLLETVRLHPLLVTATAESERNCERWKEIQPHDVVVECMRLALPFRYHDVTSKEVQQQQQQHHHHGHTATWYDSQTATTASAVITSTAPTASTITNNAVLSATNIKRHHYQQQEQKKRQQHYEYRDPYQSRLADSNGNISSLLWSPYHEIINFNHVPLTPTQAPYLMPTTHLVNRTNFGITGCSPPEAAVEATPETTPLKDNRELKCNTMINTTAAVTNPLAVRAIFVSSQPSSPMKSNLDHMHHNHQQQQHSGYSHFDFPDMIAAAANVSGVGEAATSSVSDVATTCVEQEFNTKIITRITTTTDRRVKQMLQDRKQSQSPFQTIEAEAIKMGRSVGINNLTTTSSQVSFTSDVESVPPSQHCQPSYNLLSNITAMPTPMPTPTPLQISSIPLSLMQEKQLNEQQQQPSILTKVCDECNETEQTMCSEGGLQMPTSRSVQLLAKGITRRNRMTSYCYNENSYERNGDGKGDGVDDDEINIRINGLNKCKYVEKIRRTKSCSSLPLRLNINNTNKTANILGLSIEYHEMGHDNGNHKNNDNNNHVHKRSLQKRNRVIGIPSAFKVITASTNTTNSIGTTSCVNNSNVINENKSLSLLDKYVQTIESVPVLNYELLLLQMLLEGKDCRPINVGDGLGGDSANSSGSGMLRDSSALTYQQTPNEILEQFIAHGLRTNCSNSGGGYDHEQFQLLCLQLQYERYRREIHAERNRRLMGRSRDKRSLEMERDRLKEQLIDFEAKNHKLNVQLDSTIKKGNECERQYQKDLEILQLSYQNELDENRCLRQQIEVLENNLKTELAQRKEIHDELELLRNQVFSLTTELQNAQEHANMGAQCKQELTRIEADFILMGEMQIKCRERLMDLENFKARDEELQKLQDAYKIELIDLKHNFDEKCANLDSLRYKLQEVQAQLINYEKVMTEQKRLLRAVKDEYEEKFKALNKKYEIQKTIIAQIEEKFMMSQQKPMPLYNSSNICCSPDTDKTDIPSSVEHNSPLSTSLASSESLSTSLRSTELRNLQQLVEPSSVIPEINAVAAAVEAISSSNSSGGIGVLGTTIALVNMRDDQEIPSFDLATSANTASNILQKSRHFNKLNSPEDINLATTTSVPTVAAVITSSSSDLTHMHSQTHKHKEQQQKHKQHQQHKL